MAATEKRVILISPVGREIPYSEKLWKRDQQQLKQSGYELKNPKKTKKSKAKAKEAEQEYIFQITDGGRPVRYGKSNFENGVVKIFKEYDEDGKPKFDEMPLKEALKRDGYRDLTDEEYEKYFHVEPVKNVAKASVAET